jgi:hypothetical protein
MLARVCNGFGRGSGWAIGVGGSVVPKSRPIRVASSPSGLPPPSGLRQCQ